MGIFMGQKRPATFSIRRLKGLNLVEGERVFRVVAFSKFESEISLLSTPGLPIVGLTVSASLGVCKSKFLIRHPDNATEYEAVCGFSSEVEEGTDPLTPQGEDPTTLIPHSEVLLENARELFTRDVNGDGIVDTAGQQFSHILDLPSTITRQDFFQFEPAALGRPEIMGRNNLLNHVALYGFPAQSLLLTIRRARLAYFFAHRCWLVEYTLRYKPPAADGLSGWRKFVPCVGPKALVNGALEDYYPGQPGVAGNLDALGARVAEGAPPFVKAFHKYKTNGFQFLRLR